MNERSRQSLVRKLEAFLGPEDTLTLMASLPPVPWSELATKSDLAMFEERMNLRMESWVATLRGETKDLSRDLTMTMVTTFQSQTRNLMIGMVGTMVAFAGVVFSVLKLN